MLLGCSPRCLYQCILLVNFLCPSAKAQRCLCPFLFPPIKLFNSTCLCLAGMTPSPPLAFSSPMGPLTSFPVWGSWHFVQHSAQGCWQQWLWRLTATDAIRFAPLAVYLQTNHFSSLSLFPHLWNGDTPATNNRGVMMIKQDEHGKRADVKREKLLFYL